MVAPANDNFANAAPVTLTAGEFTSALVDSTDATTETGEPGTGDRSVWWSFTPATSGSYQIDTLQSTLDGGGPDTLLWVYTGTTLAGLTLVVNNDDVSGDNYCSQLTLNATAGTTYYIRVSRYSSRTVTAYEKYVLHVAAPATPPPPDPTDTDLTFDNDGYDYTGSGEVDDDPPVDLPPIHAREDIDRVHQSLPAPTLVDGRPT